ncbi:cell division protein ZapC domain-containing protein [Celerinatantimonas sp. YJH-8]|uniref:cell division protein ZapC domain-containing protein n=1 Tax=Celerinatantimonas sp. YJH-8 TaxID=3228714 RepID=UPI0038C98E55
MLLQPNKEWRWLFESSRQRMTLLLGRDLQFITELEGHKMNIAGHSAQEFTCEQTRRYYQLVERLQVFDWPIPVKVQVVLNALTMAEYHKPVMPQSWFFEQGSEMQPCEVGDIIAMKTHYGHADFMVLEVEATTALCMALDPETPLSSTKTLNRFGVIKVMRDRIIDQHSLLPSQYAYAG